VGVHQSSLAVELEAAVAGKADLAIRELHLEEAVALDNEVVRVARLAEITLGLNALDRGGARTQADLDPGGNLRALRGGSPGGARILVDEILEVRAAALEARRIRVGEVVGDHVHI